MSEHEPVRWGILGTANIAQSAFLPALRAAGGVAAVVGGRDAERTRRYAAEYGIQASTVGYENVLADTTVDAIYIPLPNSLHAEWIIAALQAGKAVLCEKPLCVDATQTERVLAVAHERAGLLWEAFVFPFREQTRRLDEILAAGEIGDVLEIQSYWHFFVSRPDNIRFSAELGGGALLDVGCYLVHLAHLVFGGSAESALATARLTPDGVDLESAGVLKFGSDRQLVFSCGMQRWVNMDTRIVGSTGVLRMSNPFHPRPGDTLVIQHADGSTEDRSTPNERPSFTEAIEHIHRVLWGEESPCHQATDDSLGTAMSLDLLQRSIRSGCVEMIG